MSGCIAVWDVFKSFPVEPHRFIVNEGAFFCGGRKKAREAAAFSMLIGGSLSAGEAEAAGDLRMVVFAPVLLLAVVGRAFAARAPDLLLRTTVALTRRSRT